VLTVINGARLGVDETPTRSFVQNLVGCVEENDAVNSARLKQRSCLVGRPWKPIKNAPAGGHVWVLEPIQHESNHELVGHVFTTLHVLAGTVPQLGLPMQVVSENIPRASKREVV
jgi:hypothetical protein